MKFLLFLSMLLLSTCLSQNDTHLEKINFDINTLDENGLSGKSDGKVSIDYEFCVPKEKAADVQKIDPSLKIHTKSKGRSNCNKTQVLAIGNTHQKNHLTILKELSSLDYISQINRTFWE